MSDEKMRTEEHRVSGERLSQRLSAATAEWRVKRSSESAGGDTNSPGGSPGYWGEEEGLLNEVGYLITIFVAGAGVSFGR